MKFLFQNSSPINLNGFCSNVFYYNTFSAKLNFCKAQIFGKNSRSIEWDFLLKIPNRKNHLHQHHSLFWQHRVALGSVLTIIHTLFLGYSYILWTCFCCCRFLLLYFTAFFFFIEFIVERNSTLIYASKDTRVIFAFFCAF